MLALMGCAPLASLRPAGELQGAGRSYEVGAGYVALGPRPYVIEDWQYTGQVWGTLALSRSWELAAVGAFDEVAAAGGGALRWTPLHLHRFAAGTEVEIGYAWAGFALPIAAQPLDGLWLYTAPRVGTQGIHATPALPVGISLETLPGCMVRAEWQTSWAQFYAYQRRTHLAVGIAYAW